jgi:hypothetical protein
MLLAAEALDFERAAKLRDQLRQMEGGTAPSPFQKPTPRRRKR